MTPSQIKLLADLRSGAVRLVPGHSYAPDYQAMGDCRVCGHQPESCIGSSTSPDLSASLAEMIEGLVGERDRWRASAEAAMKTLAEEDDEANAAVARVSALQADVERLTRLLFKEQTDVGE